jgi:hypothetical protein
MLGGVATVDTQNPSAAASVTFSSLSTGVFYKILYSFTQNTSTANLSLRFNGDSGSNYKWSTLRFNDGLGNAFNGSTGGGAISITNGLAMQVGEQCFGDVSFSSDPGDSSIVHANFQSSHCGSAANSTFQLGNGYYNGASSLVSATLFPDAGTFTGQIILTRMV